MLEPTTSKIDAAQIAQAEADLATAQANLDKAKLASPCDCTVQAVNVAVG